MNLKILWPGKTKNGDFRRLQGFYLERIQQLANCHLTETKEAKGIEEKFGDRIKEIEAQALEKYLKDDYIICLSDDGQEMSSFDFALFLEKCGASSRPITFVVGGFLGLADRILKKADFLLSLSKMTFSHELSRVVLLEQLYRSLTILRGKPYAK
jgi:23S rRNA (pseudouridine1915-N3)-methyltransferase